MANLSTKMAVGVAVVIVAFSLLFQMVKYISNDDNLQQKEKVYSFDLFGSVKKGKEQENLDKQNKDKEQKRTSSKNATDNKTLQDYAKIYQKSRQENTAPKDNNKTQENNNKISSAEEQFLASMYFEEEIPDINTKYAYEDFSVSYSNPNLSKTKVVKNKYKEQLKEDINKIAQIIINTRYTGDRAHAIDTLNGFIKNRKEEQKEAVRRLAEKYKLASDSLKAVQIKNKDAELIRDKFANAYEGAYFAMLDFAESKTDKEVLDNALAFNQKADKIVQAMLYAIDFVSLQGLEFKEWEPGRIFTNPFSH